MIILKHKGKQKKTQFFLQLCSFGKSVIKQKKLKAFQLVVDGDAI